MKKNNALFIRILLLSIAIGFCFYLFGIGLIYTMLFCVFLLFLLFLEFFYFIKNIFSFYDKTIQAILQNDFSADFSKHKSFKNYANLFQLYEKLKTKENDQFSNRANARTIINTFR
jgi:ABC-type transport system involved in cytochrome bd biosynthesis fused ATPase/permease subunit